MKTKPLYFFFLIIILSQIISCGQNRYANWQSISSAQDVCEAFPDRIKVLFDALDLDKTGLEEVKAAWKRQDLSTASTALLAYYKNGNQAQHLRREIPASSTQTQETAEEVLQDIFTVQGQSGQSPRDQHGLLDWHHTGPNDDKEWAWGVNRHYPIRDLMDAYLETGNTAYAQKVDKLIKEWVISSLPYPAKKSSTAMWRGLEVSFRIKNWAKVFYGLINDPNLSPATRLLMLSSIPEHAHYARNFHAQGNWLTMEMSGLAVAATAWPEFKQAQECLAYTKETMTESLAEQIYPDGVQTELTSHYHYVALNNFNQFFETCQEANVSLDSSYVSTLKDMWNYLAYTMRPDGYGIMNNDSDRDFNRDRIIKASDKFDRPDWLHVATNGVEGLMPKTGPSAVFPWAGQMIMRSGYEAQAQWTFFDIGPWGSGHQHNDKLHISISAFGKDFLVDGGRFAYRGEVADKFRHYARKSFSHNVVLIDGKSQAAGPRRAEELLSESHYTIKPDFDYAWNKMDAFEDLEGKAEHKRALFYLRGKAWIVIDQIETDRPRNIQTLWHWHPDCELDTMSPGPSVRTNFPDGNLIISPVDHLNWELKQIKGQEKPQIQGWYSAVYNQVQQATCSNYSTQITESTTFVWLIAPFEKTQNSASVKILSKDEDAVTLELYSAGEAWQLKIPFSNSAEASAFRQ